MRRLNTVDRLLARLRSDVASSPELEQALGVSQSSISCPVRRLAGEGRVVRIGSTRGARYGSRREIEGIGSSWPLRRVEPYPAWARSRRHASAALALILDVLRHTGQ